MIITGTNNRFLQRTNTEIKRAGLDAGSDLVSRQDETQPLMRQMVDMGIADNLKLWVHSGLVKTRTSGSNLYVPKAYDISGEENDATQSTEANQPKLVSDGMEFDGNNDYLDLGDGDWTTGLEKLTITAWLKFKDMDKPTAILAKGSYYHSTGSFFFGDSRSGDPRLSFSISNSCYRWTTPSQNEGNYVFYAVTYNKNTPMISLYENGVSISDGFSGTAIAIPDSDNNLGIGIETTYPTFDGGSDEIRVFDVDLTPNQILKIYNTTKSKYGHPPIPEGAEVGDKFGGGIIAYIGEEFPFIGGLIAAEEDIGASTGYAWGCYGTTVGASGTALGTGKNNTNEIVNNCDQSGIAAKMCNDLILNGYSDWYLPSEQELNQLYLNKGDIGGFDSAFYWSSSESSSNGALRQSFFSGNVNSGNKSFSSRVRAVRGF